MRSKRTGESPRLTLVRGGGGAERNGSVSDSYGLTNLVLTTWQRTQDQALTGLLNDLESEVQTLESRYLEVCATLNIVMSDLVRLGLFGMRKDTTDLVE
jgi:hypothetical protein